MMGIRTGRWMAAVAVCVAVSMPGTAEAQSAWQMRLGTGGGMAPSTRLGEDATLHAGLYALREGGTRFMGLDFARAEVELGLINAVSVTGARYVTDDTHRRVYLLAGLDVVRVDVDDISPLLGVGARLETLPVPVYSEVRLRVINDLGRTSALSVLAGVIW